MGSSGNYGSQINTALQQANMPKSPLAQDLSGAFQNNYQNIFQGLMNGGSQNAFPGLMSGQSTPGQTFNGGGQNIFQPATQQQLSDQPVSPQQQQPGLSSVQQVLAKFMGTPTQTYQTPSGSQYVLPQGQQPINASVQQGQNPLFQQATSQGPPTSMQPGFLAGLQQTTLNPNYQPTNNSPFNMQGGGGLLASLGGYSPVSGGQQPTEYNPPPQQGGQNLSSLFPQIAQSNPQQGSLQQGGVPPNLMQQLMQSFQSPQVNTNNPSAGLLQQVQGSAGQNNVPGLQQSLQQALSGLGNVGGAQLPQNNFNPTQVQNANPQNVASGNANLQLAQPQTVNSGLTPQQLQSANPQNVNPGNVGLQLGGPQNVNLQQANLQTGLPNAQDSAYYDATQQILGNQYNQGLKDLQSRFGAAGGASRGTPAAFAQSQYAAQALPQLQAALGNVRQQEVGNQLTAQNQANNANLTARGQDLTNSQQNVSNQLTGQNQANNALLQNRQQDINNSQQNVQNLLQSVGLNNNSQLQLNQQNLGNQQQNVGNQLQANSQNNNALLQNQQQNLNNSQQNVQNQLQASNQNNNANLQNSSQLLQLLGLNQQGSLQNQGLINQGGIDSLNALSGLFGQQGSLNNSLLGNLGNIANNSGNLSLGQNQLQSQNAMGNNQLQSQNINNLLSQLGNFQGLNNQATLGQNQLNSQNSQFNAGQQNSLTQQYMNQLQQANQNQINNQFTGNQNLAQILAQFGLSGIPGGSANVNLGAQSQSGTQQLTNFLSSLGSLF